MTLGEKLLRARQEAGFSQRQLCGDVITRNMLSQIEHGTARPSMDTLRYLAAKLGKSVGYFLDEQALESPNGEIILRARAAFKEGDFEKVSGILKAFREPDEVLGREKAAMETVVCLKLAEQALSENRGPYALQLLAQAEKAGTIAGLESLTQRQRLLLLAQAGGQAGEAVEGLPSLDSELLLRAEAALSAGKSARAAALLEAAENQDCSQWRLLRGRVWMAQGKYASAAKILRPAEETHPEVLALLEQCYREIGDFRRAYEYACKQKK